MAQHSITFIGGGNMATSLIGGLVATGYDSGRIRVGEPLAQRRQELAAQFEVEVSEDNAALVRVCDVLVLAVKPQVMAAVIRGLAAAAKERQPLIVSIAAGITAPDICRWLGYNAAVVRTMPNTPALVSSGITGMFANEHVSDAQREAANDILRAVGPTVWLDNEDLIDAVTAISGSGPAYFFRLIELLVAAGQELGLSESVATELATHTALGAAKMALASDDSPAVLRERVTSPGGTTAAALQAFDEGGLADLVRAATVAARDRGRELARELGDA